MMHLTNHLTLFQNFETIILQFIKPEEYDVKIVSDILTKYLDRYPGSVTFTFFKGLVAYFIKLYWLDCL